jgi:hypothetical protein
MTEEDAKLALLQTELNGVQNSIRSLDAIDFQIKGWCVTTGLAIGGFAVAYKKPVLLLVGMAAVIGFYLVNCQFKGIQRAFIRRNSRIDSELKKAGIMHFLSDSSSLDVVGTSIPEWRMGGTSWRSRARNEIEQIMLEAKLPNTFSLYLFIFVCLLAEALTLFLTMR